MAQSRHNQVDDTSRGWLARAVASGRLIGLPSYRPKGGCFAQRPEKFARRMLAQLEECPDNPPGPVREVLAFRNWVEAQPRPHPWSSRSQIDLDGHHFDSLRTRPEIHHALESIAHPDPNAPGFAPPYPASARLRAKEARSGLIARRRAILSAWLPTLMFLLLVLASMGFVGLAMIPGMAQRLTWRDLAAMLAPIVAGTLLLSYLLCNRGRGHGPRAAKPKSCRSESLA
jgi:hypothetical protein